MEKDKKMQGISIVGTGSYIPENIVTNEDISKKVDTSDEWIQSRTGIEMRHFCTDEGCTDLAVNAAKRAIENAKIEKEDIGIVIVATSTSDYVFPACACLVQKELELTEEVIAFDIQAACTGFLYGLEVCRGLLNNSKKPYALLIGSEQMSRILDFTDRSTCVLFGDGAGAVVLKASENPFFHRAWASGKREVLYMRGAGNDNSHLIMKGNDVFRFAVGAIRQAINQIMTDAQITMDEIDYVICHQANERIIENVSRKYPGMQNKFYKNIAYYANTSAASIPIVIDEMHRKELLKKNMKILCVGFGAGLTWSGSLITI